MSSTLVRAETMYSQSADGAWDNLVNHIVYAAQEGQTRVAFPNVARQFEPDLIKRLEDLGYIVDRDEPSLHIVWHLKAPVAAVLPMNP